MSALGSDSALRLCWINLRFTPESSRVADIPDRQVRANNGLLHRSKRHARLHGFGRRLHWQVGWLLTLEDARPYSPAYTRLSGKAGVSRRHA